ncbi:CIR protein [Plasmodium chabaudi chabaudi]|uniref:CIR protein n=1 Tax=Plasmodium chabaudi chabaudi TaxID=31271 RepID=A0A4V0K368_PLACU|nr:CIR protein [Plasmodium chabaudi chabaudi]VTZ66759.1 CIR protein [Plasmodium chabaudi chabaudi]|eukprot:XP_016655692.1 CIR protein [Plasmodium chabaudi chabaudi]
MRNPSYKIEDVYKEFATIDGYFYVDEDDGAKTKVINKAIHNYCDYDDKKREKDKCSGYYEMTSSGVIHLINNLKDKNVLDYDKLAEYAILWLSYKLKIKENEKIKKLSVFYDSYIKTNDCYNKNINGGDGLTYKAIIDKKKDLMDIDINEIFKLEAPFNILYYLYNVIHDEHPDCEKNLDSAKNFAEKYEVLLNNNDTGIDDSLYSQILSILSTDYNNLRKKCTNFPSLPVYPRNFSIKVTLIPITFIFVAIPIFLEFAYKYSLFGFGKRSQKQYLREKRKKAKRKVYNYLLLEERDYSRNSNNY